jgi:hypothetical protein
MSEDKYFKPICHRFPKEKKERRRKKKKKKAYFVYMVWYSQRWWQEAVSVEMVLLLPAVMFCYCADYGYVPGICLPQNAKEEKKKSDACTLVPSQYATEAGRGQKTVSNGCWPGLDGV